MSHPGHLRNFESTLVELCDRGHSVCMAFDRVGAGPAERRLVELVAETDSLTWTHTPARSRSQVRAIAGIRLRATLDSLRYLEPRFGGSPKLRDRAFSAAPHALSRLARLTLSSPGATNALAVVLRAAERRMPPRTSLVTFIRAQRPDVTVVTPLIEFGSPQVDVIRAAKRLGIPTAVCVASWDNLTTKGLIHEIPNTLAVWNDWQRREAVEMHGVPATSVAVTGAPVYDWWFAAESARPRGEFCEAVGLSPARPYILYVCSSPFIAPRETDYIIEWVRELRRHSGLEAVGVLVRPHPLSTLDLPRLSSAAVQVHPTSNGDPVSADARSVLFDSIFHSAAVVGLNTSAMIESAIVGRPVLTHLAPAFRDTQTGTLHFGYLADGFLTTASTLTEHARQLSDAVGGNRARSSVTAAFLEKFVRPAGLDVAATPLLAAALERTAAGTSGSTEGVSIMASGDAWGGPRWPQG